MNYMKAKLLTLVLLTSLAAQTPAWSANLLDVDLDASYFIITPAEPTSEGQGDPRPHLQFFPAAQITPKLPFVIDINTQYSVGILHTLGTDPLGTSRVISMDIHARSPSNQKDKVMLTLLDKNGTVPLQVDINDPARKRYIAFDIKFNRDYQAPVAGLNFSPIHLQGLQNGLGAPPFSIRASSDPTVQESKVKLEFRRSINALTPADEHEIHPITLEVHKEQWQRFILQLIPGYSGQMPQGTPQIAVWHAQIASPEAVLDAVQSRLFVWTGPWGYPPVPAKPDSHLIQYGIGIYRPSQQTRQGIQLRNIRYGTTFADMQP